MKRLSSRRRAAFTLVELLAAMVVLALLMVTVFGIFNQASRAWLLAENRTENFSGARAALDMMTRELEGAIVATNSLAGSGKKITLITFEDSGTDPIGGSFSPSWPTTQDTTPPNDAIFFVTQTGDSRANTYMDLAECGYYVAFTRTAAGSAGLKKGYYYLMRHFIRSHNSSGADPDFDIFSNASGWWSTPSGGSFRDQPILDNAIRFEVEYEYIDPSNPPSQTNGTSSVRNWNAVPNTAVADPNTQLPRAFHLRLSVMDRRYATRLATIKGDTALSTTDLTNIPYSIGSISQPTQRTLKEGLRTFFRSVYPRNAS